MAPRRGPKFGRVSRNADTTTVKNSKTVMRGDLKRLIDDTTAPTTGLNTDEEPRESVISPPTSTPTSSHKLSPPFPEQQPHMDLQKITGTVKIASGNASSSKGPCHVAPSPADCDEHDAKQLRAQGDTLICEGDEVQVGVQNALAVYNAVPSGGVGSPFSPRTASPPNAACSTPHSRANSDGIGATEMGPEVHTKMTVDNADGAIDGASVYGGPSPIGLLSQQDQQHSMVMVTIDIPHDNVVEYSHAQSQKEEEQVLARVAKCIARRVVQEVEGNIFEEGDTTDDGNGDDGMQEAGDQENGFYGGGEGRNEIGENESF